MLIVECQLHLHMGVSLCPQMSLTTVQLFSMSVKIIMNWMDFPEDYVWKMALGVQKLQHVEASTPYEMKDLFSIIV